MNQQINFRPFCRACGVCVLLMIGGFAGSRVASDKAHAEVRKNDPRAAFLSGSERSEQILREISQTLKAIDGRLARFEKMAAQPRN